ncbi:NACHT domain-containing protein [Rubritalea spongiae]|uniref:NACHT domain-containing protein n=1 Tax=Rubritalea spongiae TaxID=430797 RepID=A0ABW5E8P5_9BACT
MQNFSSFNSTTFEQLAREISLEVIGSHVKVFGNGPDGGREAIFEGPTKYLNWDGYGVIQAKFKEKSESTQIDQNWAEKQLKNELELWKTKGNRQPKPDYFIYVTNVELSSAINGGKDRVTAVLEDYKENSSLKGYAIWDAIQLIALIGNSESIRNKYTDFFTHGDFLHQLVKRLPEGHDYDQLLQKCATVNIQECRNSKIGQAGDRTEAQINLADVFVDLPVDSNSEENTFLGFEKILHLSEKRLNPKTLYQGLDDEAQRKNNLENCSNFLFLGGPGSGKSTFGQFFAQTHRAAILSQVEPATLNYQVRSIIKGIQNSLRKKDLSLPNNPRFPLVVELNEFAKKLADKDPTTSSLSIYLQSYINSDLKCPHSDFIKLLQQGRWVLILDGLDEVPTSSNRAEVIKLIQEFTDDCRACDIDLMVIASSREEGYEGEFNDDILAELKLQHLGAEKAEECAKNYIRIRQPNRKTEQEKTLAIIKGALKTPLVAKLMISPLQVTFMVTIVAASGKPSNSRWRLFNEYYNTIYSRELQKSVSNYGKIISERRTEIDTLHHRSGVILQHRGESEGGTTSELETAEFQQLITQCLKENEVSEGEIHNLVREICDASRLRLVFLTKRTANKIGFPVRSLQEYMAAAHITNRDSSEIIKILHTISHSSYWRNTLLFCIGRFFSDPSKYEYRDLIRSFCEDCNAHSHNEISKVGSKIAIDILVNNLSNNSPQATKSLSKTALEVLDIPAFPTSKYYTSLADGYTDDSKEVFKKAILEKINSRMISKSLSAWLLLIELTNRDIEWANDTLKQNWPNSIEDQSFLLSRWLNSDHSKQFNPIVIKLIEDLILNSTIGQNAKFVSIRVIERISSGSPFLKSIIYLFDDSDMVFIASDPTSFQLGLVDLPSKERQQELEILKSYGLENAHEEWKFIICFIDYLTDPTSDNLSKSYLKFRSLNPPEHIKKSLSFFMPWTVAACVSANLEYALDTDLMNDRWECANFDIKNELQQPSNDNIFYIAHTIRIGHGDNSQEGLELYIKHFLTLLKTQAPPTEALKKSALTVVLAIRKAGNLHELSPSFVKEKILPLRDWSVTSFEINPINIKGDHLPWIDFFDCLGRDHIDHKNGLASWFANNEFTKWVLESWIKHPHKKGLLLLSSCLIGDKDIFASLNREIPQMHATDELEENLSYLILKVYSSRLDKSDITSFDKVSAQLAGESRLRLVTKLLKACKTNQTSLSIELVNKIYQANEDLYGGYAESIIHSYMNSFESSIIQTPVMQKLTATLK